VIRVIATILIAVQALLPPGMCFCQFVHSGPVASRQAHAPAPSPQPSVTLHVEDSCCSCPACRKATEAVTPQAQEQAEPEREAPHERHPAPASPSPTPPCSGCPVVAAGPVARAAILPAPEQAPLDAAVPFVLPAVEADSPHADRPGLLVAPVTPPLFVRHCAFLI
jgi:hypothetical protein